MIPTLAERSRRQQLQVLALKRSWPASPVTAEPPLGLQAFLAPKRLTAEPIQLPSQRATVKPATPVTLAPSASLPGPSRPLPAWLELLLWLVVLLIEAAEALRGLRLRAPSQPRPFQRPFQRRWWSVDQASSALNRCSQQQQTSLWARFC